MFSLLNLDEYISQLKEAGVDLVKLAKLITSFKMENPDNTFSISACATWGNQPEILRYFGLEPFDEQTLYRAVRTIGDNFESILKYLEKQVFSHTPTKPSAILNIPILLNHPPANVSLPHRHKRTTDSGDEPQTTDIYNTTSQ